MSVLRQYARTFFTLRCGKEKTSEEIGEAGKKGDIHIRRIQTTSAEFLQSEDTVSKTRAKIAVIITWILAIILFFSFACVVVCAVIGRVLPDVVTNAFWASLGYIGGSFVSFMGTYKSPSN